MRSFVKRDSKLIKREFALKNNLKKRKKFLNKLKKKSHDSTIR
jgi:hypothetical protein